MNKFIFISGTIGVGKSTLIDYLLNVFNAQKTVLIKEFIDYYQDGEEKLNKHLKGEMNSFDFQKYVIDCYIDQIKGYENKTILMERHPMESILFARQFLTPKEACVLENYIKNLCKVHAIPLPSECKILYSDNMDIQKTAQSVDQFVKNYSNVIVHLSVTEKTQVERLRKRNRESDFEYLKEKDMIYLKKINQSYEKLMLNNYSFNNEITFYLQDAEFC